ncbi:MAG: GntR family transcriptional regulator [Hyphomicrobiales bacterium]|nr:GntR family transcriptional regulator [Hyphomicrobiales bacterium]
MARLTMAPVLTAGESAYQTLTRAIVDGSLKPNEALSDRELSLQLGVSRTPIREAFVQLEAAGLLRRRGRIGWVVTALERRDVEELIEVRTVLETVGIRKMLTWSDDALRPLTVLFDSFSLPMSEPEIDRYLANDHKLHVALIDATDNRRIIDYYRYVECHIDRVRHFISYSGIRRVDQSLLEHRRICDGLRARDAGTACRALAEHLTNVKTSFLELLDNAVSNPPSAMPD